MLRVLAIDLGPGALAQSGAALAESLRIGTDPTFAPCMLNKGGHLASLDNASRDEVCRSAALDCTWTQDPFQRLDPCVADGADRRDDSGYGQIDLCFGSNSYLLEARTNDSARLEILDQENVNSAGAAIALRKGDRARKAKIDRAPGAMEADGRLKKLTRKWIDQVTSAL